MRYTLSLLSADYQKLVQHLFLDARTERAAYLLCSISHTESESRLLAREVIPVAVEEIEEASERHLIIKQASYVRAIRRAADAGQSFIFVHSHPLGAPDHSDQDDREEPGLFRMAYNRIHADGAVHGSIVLSGETRPVGRVWLEDGTNAPMDRVRVIGDRFAFYDLDLDSGADISAFDRQILAFGEDVQRLLRRLHIGIVGYGGTGSSVFEQLMRLGVGSITVCDPQAFETTNINRVYGSRISDQGKEKTAIADRHAKELGLGTVVRALPASITDLAVTKAFRDCDIVFGCTDDEWGRSVLIKLALYYLIPLIDLGVMIDSEAGSIRSVLGRVTTIIPGTACLLCRERIDGAGIRADVLRATNPQTYKELVEEGYVRGLGGVEPSVVMFTTATAAMALSELMHRLTSYMGAERIASEILMRFDDSKISRNSIAPKADCWCSRSGNWAVGDRDPLLDLSWVS
jgi:molybdopterin/thiamine biosynthesis adenylyltransferase